MSSPVPPPADSRIPIKKHVFDGIAEYDQRLPNWWLYTLYAGIAFWIVYWFFQVSAGIGTSDGAQVDAAMARLAAVKMASSIDVSDDGKFWEMSRNSVFVDAGKQAYAANCVACHLVSLRGKTENPAAIGPDLTDAAWLHGGTPKDVYATVAKGILPKGMPAWEPVLGQKKAAEIVAYLLSHHQPGETITVQPAN